MPLSLTHTCHAPRPFFLLDFIIRIILGTEAGVMKLLIVASSPFPYFMVRLMPISLLQHKQLLLIVRGNQRVNLEEHCLAWNVINIATFKHERAERKVFVPTVV